jgi:hypothetical protein
MAGVWNDRQSLELVPQSYHCDADGEDLTILVEEELAERVPVAFARGLRPFLVNVRCPSGGGHDVSCTGQVRYG